MCGGGVAGRSGAWRAGPCGGGGVALPGRGAGGLSPAALPPAPSPPGALGRAPRLPRARAGPQPPGALSEPRRRPGGRRCPHGGHHSAAAVVPAAVRGLPGREHHQHDHVVPRRPGLLRHPAPPPARPHVSAPAPRAPASGGETEAGLLGLGAGQWAAVRTPGPGPGGTLWGRAEPDPAGMPAPWPLQRLSLSDHQVELGRSQDVRPPPLA